MYSVILEASNTQSYNSIYEGYSDDGLKFSTDLNVIRIYTVNNEEYYKIPVNTKEELKKIDLEIGYINKYYHYNDKYHI